MFFLNNYIPCPDAWKQQILTDLDLPPIARTQANYWEARYWGAYKELVKANKGLRRLRKKLDRMEEPPKEEK